MNYVIIYSVLKYFNGKAVKIKYQQCNYYITLYFLLMVIDRQFNGKMFVLYRNMLKQHFFFFFEKCLTIIQ